MNSLFCVDLCIFPKLLKTIQTLLSSQRDVKSGKQPWWLNRHLAKCVAWSLFSVMSLLWLVVFQNIVPIMLGLSCTCIRRWCGWAFSNSSREKSKWCRKNWGFVAVSCAVSWGHGSWCKLFHKKECTLSLVSDKQKRQHLWRWIGKMSKQHFDPGCWVSALSVSYWQLWCHSGFVS